MNRAGPTVEPVNASEPFTNGSSASQARPSLSPSSRVRYWGSALVMVPRPAALAAAQLA